MGLKTKDFVAIRAGYGTKSDQLRSLAESLNLGLDSIVFIDDNPMELVEVRSALPTVTCIAFPTDDDAMPSFLDSIGLLFDRNDVTCDFAKPPPLPLILV